MGFFNKSNTNYKESDINEMLVSLGAFVSGHSYMTLLSGSISVQMMRMIENPDDATYEFIITVHKELASITEALKTQLEKMISNTSSIANEDIIFLEEYVDIYDMLKKRSDALLSFFKDGDEIHLERHDKYFNNASERITYWIEEGKKSLEKM